MRSAISMGTRLSDCESVYLLQAKLLPAKQPGAQPDDIRLTMMRRPEAGQKPASQRTRHADTWMNNQTDREIAEWADGFTHRWTDTGMRAEPPTHGQTEEWNIRQTGRWTSFDLKGTRTRG